MAFMLEAWAQVGQQPSVAAASKENTSGATPSTSGLKELGKTSLVTKAFHGTCHNCQAQGHKAMECPAKSRQPLQVVTQGTSGTIRSAPDLSNIICHKCHNKGHYANRCPQTRSSSAVPLRLNYLHKDTRANRRDGLEDDLSSNSSHDNRYTHKKVRFNNEAADEKSQE